MSQKSIVNIGDLCSPPPPGPPSIYKVEIHLPSPTSIFLGFSNCFGFTLEPLTISSSTEAQFTYKHLSFFIVMSSCHVSMSSVTLSWHLVTHIITNLIRIHLDNIYVNKLTMKQIAIHICKLIHSCEQMSAEQYMQ